MVSLESDEDKRFYQKMAWACSQGYELRSGLFAGEARDEALLPEGAEAQLEAAAQQRTRGWLLRESH